MKLNQTAVTHRAVVGKYDQVSHRELSSCSEVSLTVSSNNLDLRSVLQRKQAFMSFSCSGLMEEFHFPTLFFFFFNLSCPNPDPDVCVFSLF